LAAHLNALEKSMRDAAADLDFEKAARLRDEIKRLKAAELAVMDDPIARDEARAVEKKSPSSALPGTFSPSNGEKGQAATSRSPSPRTRGEGRGEGQASYFAKPDLDDMGRDIAEPSKKSLFRRNDLDEMTVGRTEKPVTGKLPPKPSSPPPSSATSPSSSSGPTRGSADDPRPLVRGKIGAGSYEDGGEQKRKGRTKGKTGRPGR